MFVYKHKEIIEYVKKLAYFLRKMQILRVNNSYEFLRNFRVLFLYEFKYMGRFSNLHWCTFKETICNYYVQWSSIDDQKIDWSIINLVNNNNQTGSIILF